MPDNNNPILKSHSIRPDLATLNSSSSSIQTKLIQIDQRTYTDYPKLFRSPLREELPSSSSRSDDDDDIDNDQEEEEERIDPNEIFDLIRSITDPEHPLTLEDLSVVSTEQISVTYPDDSESSPHVMVRFTPTIPHCSMATLIGLTLRVRLLRSLPERFKVDIKIKEGTHQSEKSVNKQLNDKERVAAALENNHLLGVVEQCLKTAHLRGRKETPSPSL